MYYAYIVYIMHNVYVFLLSNNKNANATATLAKSMERGISPAAQIIVTMRHVVHVHVQSMYMCSACDVIVKNQCVICVKIIYVMTYILLIVKASLVS